MNKPNKFISNSWFEDQAFTCESSETDSTMKIPTSSRFAVTVSALLLAMLTAPVTSQDCPCEMSGSTAYPGMFVWDCSSLALVEVPGDCFTIRSENVSEFILSHNAVTDIRSTTLIDLLDLKELRLDYNSLAFVDPTAFEFMHDLEVITFDHNLDLTLEFEMLEGQDKLTEFSAIGTSMTTLPSLIHSSVLSRVDVRSSKLTGLPLQLLSPTLSSTSFYLNLHANEIQDVAASALLDLPDDTILNLDTFVLVWSRTEQQREELLSKPWTVNIDLQASSRLCEVEGLPGDLTICYDLDKLPRQLTDKE